MDMVFEPADAAWRGLGTIPLSGLKIRKEYAAFDAQKVFDIKLAESEDPKGCACGEILLGLKIPPQCLLYKKNVRPFSPSVRVWSPAKAPAPLTIATMMLNPDFERF